MTALPPTTIPSPFTCRFGRLEEMTWPPVSFLILQRTFLRKGRGERASGRLLSSSQTPSLLSHLTRKLTAFVSLTHISWELVRLGVIYLFTQPCSSVKSLLLCVQISSALWIIYMLSQIHVLWTSYILHVYYILCDVHKIIILIVLGFVNVKMDFFFILYLKQPIKFLVTIFQVLAAVE